jgi:hypothetical protein
MMSFQDNVNQMLGEIETTLDSDELESKMYHGVMLEKIINCEKNGDKNHAI